MPAPAIEVNNLSYKYPTGDDWALREVSFSVQLGEILGIVGPTGAGKTTLAMCLRGLIPHNTGGTFGGKVFVGEQDTLAHTPGQLADKVGIVFQNAETQVVGLTVVEDLAFGLENMNLAPEEMDARIQRVARLVKVDPFLERESFALSGGQKQRLAIGGVLVMEPNILLLDEPTAELDPVGKAQVFEIVRKLQQEHHLTIVMIEHEVEALAEVSDRLLLLHQGHVAALGPTEEVFREKDLFTEARERVPFVAELMADLIDGGVLPPEAYACREDAAIQRLQRRLRKRVTP